MKITKNTAAKTKHVIIASSRETALAIFQVELPETTLEEVQKFDGLGYVNTSTGEVVLNGQSRIYYA